MLPDEATSPDSDAGTVALTDRDLSIVAAVVSGLTYADAGLLAGCSESTVDRTMARPEVRAAADAARQRRAAQIADMLDARVDTARPGPCHDRGGHHDLPRRCGPDRARPSPPVERPRRPRRPGVGVERIAREHGDLT
jgi:hypothetical protein